MKSDVRCAMCVDQNWIQCCNSLQSAFPAFTESRQSWIVVYTTDMVTKKPLQRKQCNVFFWPRGTKKEGQRIFRKKTFTAFFKAKKGLFYVRFWSQFLPFLKQYFKTLFESINALIKPCYQDIWPVAQFSRLSFDTTCLYVFAENKLISNVKKVSFFLEHPVFTNDTIFSKVIDRKSNQKNLAKNLQ